MQANLIARGVGRGPVGGRGPQPVRSVRCGRRVRVGRRRADGRGDRGRRGRPPRAGAAATPQRAERGLLETVGLELAARAEELGAQLVARGGQARAEGVGEVAARAPHLPVLRRGGAAAAGGARAAACGRASTSTCCREPLGVVGRHHAVELPDRDPGVEDRAGARLRQRGGLQARRAGAGAAPGRWPRSSRRAGLPPGVFNLVIGPRRAWSARLVRRPADVRGDQLHRLGQAPGARRRRAAWRSGSRKVQLEMGGKNPLVVLDDADLDVAVDCAVQGAFFSTGQRCTAISRLIVTGGHPRPVRRRPSSSGCGAAGRQRARAPAPRSARSSTEPADQDLDYIGDRRGARAPSSRSAASGSSATTDGYYLEPALFVGTAQRHARRTARRSSGRSPR